LRIFNYPAIEGPQNRWSVAEHTDYGLLTLVGQDHTGGLQVKTTDGWIDVPPVDNGFVCTLGDMLDHLTGGAYRATPHRVLNESSRNRLSFPFFMDPSWDWRIERLPLADEPERDDASTRWDRSSVHQLRGTYGEYILGKVAKVFPDLFGAV
jgi:isopenicillin N synthase-like dioxygenase